MQASESASADRSAAPQPPSDPGRARRLRPRCRGLAVCAAMLLGLVAAPLWFVLRPAPAIVFAERDWLLLGTLGDLGPDARLDAPLHFALRLGLKQSRHINTISQARTAEGLAQLGLDGDAPLDRERGSALALQLGAHALLLPRIQRSGGALRVVAELVDPHTRATVYRHAHDAPAPDALIGAVDAVLRAVRRDLGELPASIDSSGPPLARISSPSLDALRAWVLANQAMRRQRYAAAAALLAEALRLDADFAMAYLTRSTLHTVHRRHAEAEADLRRAASRIDRLSRRDRLMAEATLNSHGRTPHMLNAWRAVVDLFPDDAQARYQFAISAIELANDCAPALNELPPGAQETVREKGMRLHQIARCRLLGGDLRGAGNAFVEAHASGLPGNGPDYALTLAAGGDFAAALAALDLKDSARPQAEREAVAQARLSLQLLRGEWDGFQGTLRELGQGSQDWPATGRSMVAAMQVSLAPYAKAQDWQVGADAELARLLDQAATRSQQEAHAMLAHAGAIAWTLARHVDAPATPALVRWTREAQAFGPQPLADLVTLVRAERLLRAADAAGALALLEDIDPARAPFLFRAVRMRALLDRGKHAAALADCSWLRQQLGRALAERIAGGVLQPINLIERSLATARMEAELPGRCPPDAASKALHAALHARA